MRKIFHVGPLVTMSDALYTIFLPDTIVLSEEFPFAFLVE